ncbi:MAG TPA: type II toxin-antitoxin system PemK/MazF family toxin [Algoriphagus sp.]|nr:type II toxin-antitoxin system PemK/MazF family toxin [Algoriphagus sp.]
MKNGEIWLVDFSPKVGQEIDKVRPAIIVNHNSVGVLRLKIVVPLTDAIKSPKEWLIQIFPDSVNGLSKLSVADCFQIKSLSEDRFIRKIGSLTNEDTNKVRLGLIKVLGLI